MHQIELEMQNAELRQARDETEKLLEKYTDLYDFAPVGYFTIDNGVVIRELNLTGAQRERSKLIGHHFTYFISAESRPAFATFLANIFGNEKISLEATLVNKADQIFYVQIVAMGMEAGPECQLEGIDITERRR